jgi:hypothetical protein
MNVVIYAQMQHQKAPAERMARGLAVHGIASRIVEPVRATIAPCDLAVMWGVRNERIIQMQKSVGNHYLVMERGYIGDRFKWTSLGFDGLNGRATFPTIDDGLKRWNENFEQYVKPWRENRMLNPVALIMGQVPGDSSLSGVDFPKWIEAKARQLNNSFYRVYFRRHPQDKTKTLAPVPIWEIANLAESLEAVDLVVTWNSNSGVDAYLAGNIVWADDPGSMVWGATKPGREAWKARMAYTQWLPEEIESGAAWDALRTVIYD